MSETQDAIEVIDARLEQVIGKVGELLEKYGPEVQDVTLDVVRIYGVGGLLKGILYLCMAVVIGFFARWFYRYGKTNNWEDPVFTAALPMVGAVGLALLSWMVLSNVWYWAAIFYPEAYIVHKITGL